MPLFSIDIPKKIYPVIIVLRITGDEIKDRILRLLTSELIDAYSQASDNSGDVDVEAYVVIIRENGIKESTGLMKCDCINVDDLVQNGQSEDGSSIIELLDQKMSRKALFSSEIGYYPPVVYWLVDTESQFSDVSFDNSLSHNRWYRNATKWLFSFEGTKEFSSKLLIVDECDICLPEQLSDNDIFSMVDILSDFNEQYAPIGRSTMLWTSRVIGCCDEYDSLGNISNMNISQRIKSITSRYFLEQRTEDNPINTQEESQLLSETSQCCDSTGNADDWQ